MLGLKPYLQLMRPANIVTAIADVLAGVAIALVYTHTDLDVTAWPAILALVVSTIGLYGGGVVFNDVFDAALDARERPERPIPSGRISKGRATVLGIGLFGVGLIAAAYHNMVSVVIAAAIVLSCLVYDRWAKHIVLVGPLVMGTCRGLNLLLGISFITEAIPPAGLIAGIPVLYIAAVTTISRGEVHGGSRLPLILSAAGYVVVIGLIAYLGNSDSLFFRALLALFALFVFPPLIGAIQTPSTGLIRKSVKHGVLGLIFMNAAWAAASGNWVLTLTVLALFPLSIGLARLFAVT